MVKLVFVDMDDTFLTPEKTITPLNRQALDLAYERGLQFVPCTCLLYTSPSPRDS